jgi:hypothetical protein
MSDGRDDVYVDADGSFFPLSDQYSARILLLSGEYFRNMSNLKSKRQEKNLQFISFINEDSFLKAQFTQLDIDANGDINVVPLVGNHIIEFGEPTNIENRLNGACARYLNYKKTNRNMLNALFVEGNSTLNIRSGTNMFNDKANEITKSIFGSIGVNKSLGPAVERQHGKGINGFDVSSCQFAIHYMFENKKTFYNFLLYQLYDDYYIYKICEFQ